MTNEKNKSDKKVRPEPSEPELINLQRPPKRKPPESEEPEVFQRPRKRMPPLAEAPQEEAISSPEATPQKPSDAQPPKADPPEGGSEKPDQAESKN